MIATSCGNNNPKTFDNLDYQQLNKEAIDIFTNDVCIHPHPTYYWGSLNKWITEYAQNTLKATVYRDAYKPADSHYDKTYWKDYENYQGNMWFDIPSTKGWEKLPTTVMQAHMDMVLTVAKDVIFDFVKQPIEWEIDKADPNLMHSKNHQTTLGADDGICLAMTLAIAKNADKFSHGKLRILITADEEDGLIGGYKLGLKPDCTQDPTMVFDKDCKYFMNIDNEILGNLVKGSNGMKYFWHNLSAKYPSNKVSRDVTAIDATVNKKNNYRLRWFIRWTLRHWYYW